MKYTRAYYSLSNRNRLSHKIREQTYIVANVIAEFSSPRFADFWSSKPLDPDPYQMNTDPQPWF
jgi:hypothetical protein